MLKHVKRLSAFILAAILVCMASVPVFAETADDPVIYRWQHVKKVSWSKTSSGNKITLYATITGYSGTTYSSGSIKVRNSSGTLIAQATGISSSSNSFTAQCSFTKPAAGTYTATLTITATRSGTSEIVTSTYTFSVS